MEWSWTGWTGCIAACVDAEGRVDGAEGVVGNRDAFAGGSGGPPKASITCGSARACTICSVAEWLQLPIHWMWTEGRGLKFEEDEQYQDKNDAGKCRQSSFAVPMSMQVTPHLERTEEQPPPCGALLFSV